MIARRVRSVLAAFATPIAGLAARRRFRRFCRECGTRMFRRDGVLPAAVLRRLRWRSRWLFVALRAGCRCIITVATVAVTMPIHLRYRAATVRRAAVEHLGALRSLGARAICIQCRVIHCIQHASIHQAYTRGRQSITTLATTLVAHQISVAIRTRRCRCVGSRRNCYQFVRS